jgi:hypothetical protein
MNMPLVVTNSPVGHYYNFVIMVRTFKKTLTLGNYYRSKLVKRANLWADAANTGSQTL